MLCVYFDESGDIASSKVVSIACAVAPVQDWHIFSDKWRRILDYYGVPKEKGLHMTDFENRRGDFSNWDKNDSRAKPFISELSQTLIAHITFGCVVSMPMKDWNIVMKGRWPDNFERKRSAFIVPFQTCLEMIRETPLIPKHEKLAFMFEETKFLHTAVKQHLDTCRDAWQLGDRWGTMAYGKKFEHHPLEASDILAYEGAKHVLNQYQNEANRPERKLHKCLRLSGKVSFTYYDEQGLWSYLETYSDEELRLIQGQEKGG